jgi:urocanate hydratase
MCGATFLGVEVDPSRIEKRINSGYCDESFDNLDAAVERAERAAAKREAVSIALLGNVAEVLPELYRRGVAIDALTDQTAAHDLMCGYIPIGHTVESAAEWREREPNDYRNAVLDAMQLHVQAMLSYQQAGAIAFDYGNNLRGQVADFRGMHNAFEIPGFVPEYIRPLFCRGSGPFRWVALSGNANDIAATDRMILELYPDNESLHRWINMAQRHVRFQGLPARICWFEYGERAEVADRFNWLVESGKVEAPIVIGRDHLDCGSVASPNRETEGMLDGSDAIADWPLLNAMINAINGASWVSIHHGGGVGIGNSIHAGMVCLADGTSSGGDRLRRVLTSDPGLGVARHVDAGYQAAIQTARRHDIDIPMMLLEDR